MRMVSVWKCVRIRKGVQPSDAYSLSWLPASDLDINKQEQFTPPYGREPSELLALTCEYFAGIQSRERQEQKAQVILKRLRTGVRRTIHWLVIKCLSDPFGSAAPGAT